jgi:hypothetical protein
MSGLPSTESMLRTEKLPECYPRLTPRDPRGSLFERDECGVASHG